MSVPLRQVRTECVRLLGDPARIRVPDPLRELLRHRRRPARDLPGAAETEPAGLSRQSAVVPRSGVPASRRQGSAVARRPAGGGVRGLPRAAHRSVTGKPAGQAGPRAAETAAR